jgi:hypothetical protein
VNYDVLEDVPAYQDALEAISCRHKAQKPEKRNLAQSGFSYTPEDSSDPLLPSQVQSIGYESHNPLVNMGTTALMLLIYFNRIIFLVLAVLPFAKFGNQKAKKFYSKEFKRLFFR